MIAATASNITNGLVISNVCKITDLRVNRKAPRPMEARSHEQPHRP
jgi:hypothetical protein